MIDRITYDDIEPGTVIRSAPTALTREAIMAFARMYDPQPFHLDEAAALASPLQGLAASGWQTTAVAMRLFYDCFLADVASMGSPGFEEVRWLRPVRPDDDLTLVLTLGDKRLSASKPDRGLVSVVLDLRNGADETVMMQHGPMMVQRRGTTQQVRAIPPLSIAPIVPAGPPLADLMLTALLDDVATGHVARLGTQTFTQAIITEFATLYDPQYFHLDPEAATRSHFGGLIASGWQTAAFWMKHYIDARSRSGAARLTQGLPAAIGGPSPGFANIKWLRPVRVGESVTYGLEITGARRIGRAGWGLVTTRSFGHGADGALVFEFEGRLMWPCEG